MNSYGSKALCLFVSLGLASTMASCSNLSAGNEEGGVSYEFPAPAASASAVAATKNRTIGSSIYLMAEGGEWGEGEEGGEGRYRRRRWWSYSHS
ncbi:hypothetical protein RHI14_06545 [Thermosynechococcus sp. WL15]|uniref:hypothetical protein n=2 Tax=unclassified Thermosynechococcus TaxID=2622553 RepID=UPI00287369B7|nr:MULTISPECIES: hypothetical protein [unclassified Thermosynechococcus]WNC33832.1 hypothetical protein RHH79_06545 [Thermosynechococcus sp. PKX91]WNC41399.1 hypothetical protein RHI14_06545 [Thermosynechococcus sp. WL15]